MQTEHELFCPSIFDKVMKSLTGPYTNSIPLFVRTQFFTAPMFLLGSLFSRATEFTNTLPLTFWIGTWNVNGGKGMRTVGGTNRPIDDWLLDCAVQSKEAKTNFLLGSYDPATPVDVYAVGFEEIVDLNASNIMAARYSAT